MRGLKALVIVMGVLILAGFVVVVATIGSRVMKHAATTPAGSPAADANAPPPPRLTLGDQSLPLPSGCRVAEMTAAGGRLWLRLEPRQPGFYNAACDEILILDPVAAKLEGRLIASPQP